MPRREESNEVIAFVIIFVIRRSVTRYLSSQLQSLLKDIVRLLYWRLFYSTIDGFDNRGGSLSATTACPALSSDMVHFHLLAAGSEFVGERCALFGVAVCADAPYAAYDVCELGIGCAVAHRGSEVCAVCAE